jgi:hypothetical protein
MQITTSQTSAIDKKHEFLYDFYTGFDANSVAFKVSEISIVEAS